MRWLLIVLMCCLLAAGSVAAAETATPAEKVVAVLPFRNSSADPQYEPLADGMADLMVVLLSRAKGITLVERSALEKLLAEWEISIAGLTEEKTQMRVGKLLGAKYILTGGITVLKGRLKINAHIFEVESARLLQSKEAEGSLDRLHETAQDVASKLMKDIEIELPPLKPEAIDKSPEANLHFMRGLGYYYAHMRDHALVEFMKTIALDPKQARARYWNGRCYFDQKEYEHAKIEFERFLKDYPNHPLTVEVKGLLKQCEQEVKQEEKEERKR